MKEKSAILEANGSHQLLQKFAEWKKENSTAKDVEIHYSHAIAFKLDTRAAQYCPDESYSMLILWNE